MTVGEYNFLLIGILGGLLLALLIRALLTWVFDRTDMGREIARQRRALLRDEMSAEAPVLAPQTVALAQRAIEESESEPEDEPEEDDAPAESPTVLTYRPQDGAEIKCSCHQRPLEAGENILWWPIGGRQVTIFCRHSKEMQEFIQGFHLEGEIEL